MKIPFIIACMMLLVIIIFKLSEISYKLDLTQEIMSAPYTTCPKKVDGMGCFEYLKVTTKSNP